MMTRKDYISTSNILRDAVAYANDEVPQGNALYFSIETIQFVAEKFAELFANDNPNFDEEKFFQAVYK